MYDFFREITFTKKDLKNVIFYLFTFQKWVQR